MPTDPHLLSSTSEFDAAQRARAAEVNVPVPRMSYLPVPPYSEAPVFVYGDRYAPGGVSYQCSMPSPVPHGLPGLATEILYTAVGERISDKPATPEAPARDGIFTHWSKPPKDPAAAERFRRSRIAELEKARMDANGGNPYRGPWPIIVDTPSTVNKMVESLRGIDDPLGSVAARALLVATSMPYNPLIQVLTRSAALRFYVPAQMRTNAISTWVAGFGLTPTSPVDDMAGIWDVLVRTDDSSGLGKIQLRNARALARGSQSAMQMSTVSSAAAAIRVDSQCSYMSALFGVIETLDPALRQRALAGGDLLETRVVAADDQRVELDMVSQTLRFKKGDRLEILVDGSSTSATVKVDTVRTDRVRGRTVLDVSAATMRYSQRDGEKVPIGYSFTEPATERFSLAAFDQTPVWLWKGAMSPFAKALDNQRWIGKHERDVPRRVMPPDVALAAQH